MACSVQQVRPGVFRARVHLGHGKLRSKTFEAKNMTQARQKSAAIELAIREGVKREKLSAGTVATLVDDWAKNQRGLGRAETTQESNDAVLRRIKQRLGTLEVRDLTAQDVDGFYGWLRTVKQPPRRKPLKPLADGTPRVDTRGLEPERFLSESTIHKHHRVLKSILNQAERWDRVERVITKRATAPKPQKYRAKVQTDAVMTMLFETAPPSIQIAATIDAMLGLRRGELFGLRWSDMRGGIVEISHNTVMARGKLIDKAPKGNRSRIVPMVDSIQFVLAELRARQEADALDRGALLAADARVMADMERDPTGRTPLRPAWLSQAWSRHCRKKGYNVRIHDLRHWCATQMLQAGVPLRTVQEFLGHSSGNITNDIYGHLVEESHDVARHALQRKNQVLALPAAEAS